MRKKEARLRRQAEEGTTDDQDAGHLRQE